MELKDCTRKELLFIIEQMRRLCFSSGDRYLSMALDEVDRKRREKCLAEADRQAEHAFRMRQMYLELLAPYEGKRLDDIPAAVLDKAQGLISQAQAADRKWGRLMKELERE